MSGHIEYHPHAGCDIRTACVDAQRVADLLGVNVDFRFNDVHCIAAPGGDGVALAERQQVEQSRKLERPRDTRFASSRIETAR